MSASILSLKDYDPSKMHIGTLVANEVVDMLRNNLPPVLDWENLFQAGGAVCDRLVEEKLRPAYTTFQRISSVAWKYCGVCLRMETVERGEIPLYERI